MAPRPDCSSAIMPARRSRVLRGRGEPAAAPVRRSRRASPVPLSGRNAGQFSGGTASSGPRRDLRVQRLYGASSPRRANSCVPSAVPTGTSTCPGWSRPARGDPVPAPMARAGVAGAARRRDSRTRGLRLLERQVPIRRSPLSLQADSPGRTRHATDPCPHRDSRSPHYVLRLTHRLPLSIVLAAAQRSTLTVRRPI
jgi:hypothetical protein